MDFGVETFPAEVDFSPAAAVKIAELLAQENNPEAKLRVFVIGGGCSGFQYGFRFDDNVEEGDAVLQKDGLTLLVDAISHNYLIGATIDYREDFAGAQFVVNNPNAQTTCGCGSSFSI